MDLLTAFFECLLGPAKGDTEPLLNEKPNNLQSHESARPAEDIAAEVVQIIFTAEKSGHALQYRIKNVVHTEGWTEEIAKAILSTLQQAIEQGSTAMGHAMQQVMNTVTGIAEQVFEFARDHPVATAVFCTLIAIGVLVLVAPWVIEALGFGELGPVEGQNI